MKGIYRKQVLDNGIRVVAEKMSSVKSVSVGLWVNVGSRDEEEREQGLSHFLEHMFFKGTETRSSQDIAKEIDAMGGELNAFTSRETTTFYTKVLDSELPKAVELMSDIFHCSVFDRREILKEKQVVMEEFKMVEDDPEDLVHDLYTQSIWKGHPLGRSILGTRESVETLNRNTIVKFLTRHYLPGQIVISVAGNFEWMPLLRLLDRAFGSFTSPNGYLPMRLAPQARGGIVSKKKPLNQIHFCLGTQGLSQDHPDRYVAYTLNTLLGGGVSSRLFQQVREKRGWVYSIYSVLSSFKDAGLFSVYGATSLKTALKAIRLVIKEIKEIEQTGVTSPELEKAKGHMKGSLMLSLESTTSRMSRLAKDEIYFGRYVSLDEILKGIDGVTPKKIQRLSKDLFNPQYLTLTTLGPLSKKDLPDSLLQSA
jgi:predicted Zn-dependent peptidase